MKKSESLYGLVKSLTMTEKAYFKKYASRHVLGAQNKYVTLFNEINKCRNGYDEMTIKEKFYNEKFVKNFPVMKKYLYEMILKSLNSYYSDSGPGNEIKNNLRSIEILYKKGLFNSCAKIINSSLKLAYKTDNFNQIMELLRWKKNIINEGIYNGDYFENLEKAHQEEKEILYKLRNLSDYRLLAYRAQSIAKGNRTNLTGEQMKKEFLNILNNPLLKSEKRALSDPALITYYHVSALVFESLGKNDGAFESRKQLIDLMKSHPEKLKANISNYIITIFNILGTCLSGKMFNELMYYAKLLRSIEKTYSGKFSENDRLLIFMGSSIFELRMYIIKGEFAAAYNNLLEIEKGLAEFDKKIVKADVLQIYYMIGYGYFGMGNINEGLKWINKIINYKDVNEDSKLFVKSRLINLIMHYELGNYALLEYLIKSTYKYIRKNKFSGQDEDIVIKFLKKLPGVSSQNQILELFTESLHLLKTYRQNNTLELTHTKRFEIQNSFTDSAEFDLESWLESKITGKSFEEVVKAKNFEIERLNDRGKAIL